MDGRLDGRLDVGAPPGGIGGVGGFGSASWAIATAIVGMNAIVSKCRNLRFMVSL